MSIKTKLFIFFFILFALFSTGSWFYSKAFNKQLNEEWAERFIQKQIIFDKYRTLSPIMKEVALVKKMSQDSSIIEMALNEDDVETRENGIKAFENYRLIFKDRNYFVAFTNTQNYYFNDINNSYYGKELRYRLSQSNKDDAWFFAVLDLEDEYQINVNKDTVLGTTKVWINYLLKHENKTIGVIGTGLDLTEFLHETVDINEKGIRNLFIDKKMAIQLESDKSLIDYASITTSDEARQSLDLIVKNRDDLNNIRQLMHELENSEIPNDSRTLWITQNLEQKLLGISYLKELGWFSLTFIDSKELTLVNNFNIFATLTLLFLFFLLFVNYIYNQIILKPLAKLKNKMSAVKHGYEHVKIETIGSGEIASLSEQFNALLQVIQTHNQELEEKIQERTVSLKENEDKLNTILNSVEGYIYIKDTDYKYTYVNKHMCELFNMTYEEIIGKDDSRFLEKESAERIFLNDQRVFEHQETIKEEETRLSPNHERKVFLSIKSPLLKEDGTVYALCGISTDITQRKNIEEKNHYLAFYDVLTDLPNRRLFYDRLTQAMAAGKRANTYGAVMFLDIDNFKPLNDTYGHDIGDLLLQNVALRLRKQTREVDTVARFGGDEFIVLLGSLDENKESSVENAMRIAQKISTAIAKVYKLNISTTDEKKIIEYSCSVSIGVTLFKGESITKEELLIQADQRMYHAKKLGKNQISYYDNPEI
ncbi:diguanylate cyclase [bacterium]|nr:diguanylate cyclase [bacterium]MBU1433861.1 diguanylate cyclase [bacterium]MBU1503559.1 diguanylate cyclase [bacterium]